MHETESFIAIRDFLKTAELVNGGFIKVSITVKTETYTHPMNDTLEVTFNQSAAIYTFYSNCFYRYTKSNKINGRDYLFQWDEKDKVLFTFHGTIKIIFSRK